MSKLKRIPKDLTAEFKAGDIRGLLRKFSGEFRPFSPSQYLYRQVMRDTGRKKWTIDFAELVYATLDSWNMNHRGAALSCFHVFQKSILQNTVVRNEVDSLSKYRLENLQSTDWLIEPVRSLFKNLHLVAPGKPKFVTYAKTLHFLLPHLFAPMDRRYTLQYFYNYTSVPKSDELQVQMYCDLLEEFRKFASRHKTKLTEFLDTKNMKWNQSVPKIIDNMIIGYQIGNETK